ncbi:MAG: hypothetical protein MJ124_08410 [Lachnospiraceae bacterium]|nr:hypothetical protein [Lachnospiraceae bacterium]
MVKRIFAWIGIALLAGVYIATFICAILATPATAGMVYASLGMTIIVPVVMWVFIRMYDRAHANDDKQISASEMRKYNKRIKAGEDPEKIAKEIEERYGVKSED